MFFFCLWNTMVMVERNQHWTLARKQQQIAFSHVISQMLCLPIQTFSLEVLFGTEKHYATYFQLCSWQEIVQEVQDKSKTGCLIFLSKNDWCCCLDSIVIHSVQIERSFLKTSKIIISTSYCTMKNGVPHTLFLLQIRKVLGYFMWQSSVCVVFTACEVDRTHLEKHDITNSQAPIRKKVTSGWKCKSYDGCGVQVIQF